MLLGFWVNLNLLGTESTSKSAARTRVRASTLSFASSHHSCPMLLIRCKLSFLASDLTQPSPHRPWQAHTPSKTAQSLAPCTFPVIDSNLTHTLPQPHNLTLTIPQPHNSDPTTSHTQSHNLALTTPQPHTHNPTTSQPRSHNLTTAIPQPRPHNPTTSQPKSHNLTTQSHNLTIPIPQPHTHTIPQPHNHKPNNLTPTLPQPHPHNPTTSQPRSQGSGNLPGLPAHARYLTHSSACFDWGTFGWVISSGEVDIKRYTYFFLINSSVRGPFMPPTMKVRRGGNTPSDIAACRPLFRE